MGWYSPKRQLRPAVIWAPDWLASVDLRPQPVPTVRHVSHWCLLRLWSCTFEITVSGIACGDALRA
jgi:hypothetical protein